MNARVETQSGNNVHLPHRLNLFERGTRVLDAVRLGGMNRVPT